MPHAIHPVDHLLKRADHVPVTQATKQLANRLHRDHMVNVSDPGVKNALRAGDFVAWHIIEQVVGGGAEGNLGLGILEILRGEWTGSEYQMLTTRFSQGSSSQKLG